MACVDSFSSQVKGEGAPGRMPATQKDEQKCLLHRAVLMMVMTGIHVLGEKASRSPAPQVRIWSQLPLEPLESQEVGNWEEMKAC